MNYRPPIPHQDDCDGFYVDNQAIYTGEDDETDWNAFQKNLCRHIRNGQPGFRTAMCWKPISNGHSVYTLLESNMYDVIAETEDGYTAVFLAVSEICKNRNVARKSLPRYAEYLKGVLLKLYPGHVRKRISNRKTELIK